MYAIKSASVFHHFAQITARMTGRPLAFVAAVLLILVWAIFGPFFDYNDTWQLTINTGTTIVTFLMVFLIQNTQNLDSEAMQVKLDELIRAMEGAHNALLDLEQLDEDELAVIREKYQALARAARAGLNRSTSDGEGIPSAGGDAAT